MLPRPRFSKATVLSESLSLDSRWYFLVMTVRGDGKDW